MAGIYIHIPFCRKACVYCNFHFSTSLKSKNGFLTALFLEIDLQKKYLDSNELKSVYFGGGTPTLLNADEINAIFSKLNEHYIIDPSTEITLEANPDDLSSDYIKALSHTPINRLSIGVQSWQDKDLEYLGRIHSSAKAIQCISEAKAIGFNNITIDLIFGLPGQTEKTWLKNLVLVNELELPHISCYNLTVEPKTILAHWITKGAKAPDDKSSGRLFKMTMEYFQNKGFHHYEISNYALPGYEAVHNTSYWKGSPYLGLGPSAHSYNRKSRQWNVPNNASYIKILNQGIIPFEMEKLSLMDKYNEYLLTRLRTSMGVIKETIQSEFGDSYAELFNRQSKKYLSNGMLINNSGTIILSQKGKLFADLITSDLFAAQ